MEPTAAFDEWLDALRVRPVAPGRFRAFGSPGRRTRIFGGLVMGQALAAAAHDVDSTRLTPLSVHCDFVRAGDPHAAVDLEVTATSDGRTFATRTVVARQADRVLITMLARFHVAEPGAELQALTPPPAPPPEGLVAFSAHLAPHAARAPDWADGNLPVDVRVIDEAGPSRPLQRSWLRVGDAEWEREPGDDPPTPVLAACGVLYGSDMALIGTAPAAFGHSWTDDGVQLATLDHAVWFHRLPALGEWLLYEQQLSAVAGGRALAHGRMYTADGPDRGLGGPAGAVPAAERG